MGLELAKTGSWDSTKTRRPLGRSGLPYEAWARLHRKARGLPSSEIYSPRLIASHARRCDLRNGEAAARRPSRADTGQRLKASALAGDAV